MTDQPESAYGPAFTTPGALFKRPPERALKMWRLSCVIRHIILCVFICCLAVVLAHFLGAAWLWLTVLCTFSASWMGYRLGTLRRRWEFTGYHLGSNHVYYRCGLMFREFSVRPYSRIQVVSTESGPLMRKFNLVDVHIRTGGYHSVTIGDIDPEVAGELKDRLIRLAQERGAVITA